MDSGLVHESSRDSGREMFSERPTTPAGSPVAETRFHDPRRANEVPRGAPCTALEASLDAMFGLPLLFEKRRGLEALRTRSGDPASLSRPSRAPAHGRCSPASTFTLVGCSLVTARRSSYACIRSAIAR